MENWEIADQLSLLSKLMDIHGENAFRSKTYSIAAFTLEKYPDPVSNLSEAQISSIRNIGDSAGKKIYELIQTGELQALNELIQKTPAGVMEMLSVKGLGPKKIHTLWKELKIDSIEELMTACEQHRLSATRGFGEKTEQKIIESIAFKKQNSGKFLYAQIEDFAESFTRKLQEKFKDQFIAITGEYRRQMEVINQLEWVCTMAKQDLKNFLLTPGTEVWSETDTQLTFRLENNLLLVFHMAGTDTFHSQLFRTTGSEVFLKGMEISQSAMSEEQLFAANNFSYIPPALREKSISEINTETSDKLIQLQDIRGLIHCHSDWSDGAHTVEQMATALIGLGFEYMVISDHSKAASYANGLTEERILQQHQYIDDLNIKLAPFKIFKSIECDILGDGTLDYSNEFLAHFDLVITSIHSNLEMKEEKAMMRLLGAITNPYTTILGHMTGRLLLKRNGYPVDYKTIIDACAENRVAIEINANPRRLDMDWRWIGYALEQNVPLSIDPDAHSVDEIQLLKYGVLVAQKGGLTAENNLSSYSLDQFETYLESIRRVKGLS